MKRRDFIKLASLGSAVAAMAPVSSALACSAKNRTWPTYEKKIVIDGLSTFYSGKQTLLTSQQINVIKSSGITAINATIPYPGHDFEQTKKQIAQAKQLISNHPDILSLIKTADDIKRAKNRDQLGVIMGFQSTEMFEQDLSRITYFAKLGVRYMQLTYNNKSQFGDGGLSNDNNGLTPLGYKAIDAMEDNRVLVDLSHSGQRTVAEAIAHAKRPLTISHTGCNSIYKHPRNNDDKELKAVADKEGVIGIYLMPFLEGGEGEITAESVMRHIDHAINICGEDHVSIGSDQGVTPVNDGPEYREMIRKEVEMRIKKGISAPGETPNRPPFVPQLNSERRMELIAFYLNKRGYKAGTIDKILGENLYQLYQRVW